MTPAKRCACRDGETDGCAVHGLTDPERLAYGLATVWEDLGNLLEQGRTYRAKGGKPLRVSAGLLERVRRLRRELGQVATEAAPDLGVCRAPTIDVPGVLRRAARGRG